MKFPGLEIELKTRLAQNRWDGNQTEQFKFPNLSMPAFLKMLSQVHYESIHNDNAFADFFITEIDLYITKTIKKLAEHLELVKSTLELLPDNLEFEEYNEYPPKKLIVNTSPIGFKFVHCLVGLDQLLIETSYLKHYGLMSSKQITRMTNSIQKTYRRSYTLITRFRPNMRVPRENLFDLDTLSHFLDLTGDIATAQSILTGAKRSNSLYKLTKKQQAVGKQIIHKIKQMNGETQ